MKLTTFTDYCLRVLIYLASRPEQRATVPEIAAALQVSEHHLTKVVHFLGREGFAATLRGRGGGLMLGRDAAAIGVGDVVRRAEGPTVAAECFDPASTSQCTIAPACRLRGALADAVAAFDAALDRYTLADLVGNRAALSRVLFHPRKEPRHG
jgi:Rrf2 family nitric oxide-sensitive transcriptional repressor